MTGSGRVAAPAVGAENGADLPAADLTDAAVFAQQVLALLRSQAL
jgi:hypothetical protein